MGIVGFVVPGSGAAAELSCGLRRPYLVPRVCAGCDLPSWVTWEARWASQAAGISSAGW